MMNNKIQIIYSPTCLEYKKPGHPESPDRLLNSWKYLENKGFSFVEPEAVDESVIELVHDKKFINRVKNRNFTDRDTPNYKDIYKYACLSAGGAVLAANLCLQGKKVFSLMRPPGHHATRDRVGGFCYFNNIAIAVESIIEKAGRVAIIDFDCHHGNGTQDIFLGRENVLYISLHQKDIYPGTGKKNTDNCFNYPLEKGTTSVDYFKIFLSALEEVKKFEPKIIAVSAGFDTYYKEDLTGLNLKIEDYEIIGQKISELGIPFFAVLEGGYSKDLPECIYSFIKGWSLI